MRISDWSSDVCSSDLSHDGKVKGLFRARAGPARWAVPVHGRKQDALRTCYTAFDTQNPDQSSQRKSGNPRSEISIANLDQREFWNEQKGELWVRLQPRIDAMLAPFGEKAIATLAPAPGDGVLEIGCGTGSTTLTLAGRIGPTGRILAVDISRPMLRTAVARAAGTSAPEIAFVEADAQVHDFGPGGFDAAYSRFGMMLFADPVAAFRNILGALRPGDRKSTRLNSSH